MDKFQFQIHLRIQRRNLETSKLKQLAKKTSSKSLSRGLQTTSTHLADHLGIRLKKTDDQEAETTTEIEIEALERKTEDSIVEIEIEIVIEMMAEPR